MAPRMRAGSGNAFAGLGLSAASDCPAPSDLALRIAQATEKRGLTTGEAARRGGISEDRIDAMRRG